MIYFGGSKRGFHLYTGGTHQQLMYAFKRANPELTKTDEWMKCFYEYFKDWPEDDFTIPKSMKYEELLALKQQEESAHTSETEPTLEAEDSSEVAA